MVTMTEPARNVPLTAEEWRPHDGLGNPAPGMVVDWRNADGTQDTYLSDDVAGLGQPLNGNSPITHWRPHTPAPAGEGKITLDEMIELFGGTVPIEATLVLSSAGPDETIGDVRRKVREIAAARATPPSNGDVEGAVERVTRDLNAVDGWHITMTNSEDLRTLLSALSAHQEREARVREALERAADVREALDLALAYMVQFEPGDSRAVSNEYVAMAAAGTPHHNDEGREIIRAAFQALKDPRP